MITSSVNVASTFPGLYLVEAWGRRPLLMFGVSTGTQSLTDLEAGVERKRFVTHFDGQNVTREKTD
jgi:hypothetical protein